jgi:hypothetical protein
VRIICCTLMFANSCGRERDADVSLCVGELASCRPGTRRRTRQDRRRDGDGQPNVAKVILHLYGAPSVKPSYSLSSSCSTGDVIFSSRPWHAVAAARSDGQGWSAGPSRSDLPLTVTSTAAFSLRRPEGSSPSGAKIAPQTCIRSIREDRNHDAVMRIGGEAPRRRAHSKPRLKDHVQGRGAATSVRHLQPSIDTTTSCRNSIPVT